MCIWNPVPENRSRGIAIHNYQDAKEFRIQLTLGERVHMLKECGDWYFGCREKKNTFKGIFPKSFVQVRDFSNETCRNSVNDKQPQIVSEIASILQEWKDFYRKFYVNRDSRFGILTQKINKLVKLHHKMTISTDQLSDLIWQIDVGNRLLGLDMIVRNDRGDPLNPEKYSVIDLYRRHVTTTQKINASLDERESKPVTLPSKSYTFYLSVRRLACKWPWTDDIQLLFFLYDQKESKQFTNNFVVKCSRTMMALTDKLYNFKAVFTDLDTRDLNREKVYLVCYAIKEVPIEQVADHKIDIRRPLGVACFNLTPYFKSTIEPDAEMFHFLPLLKYERYSLENTLKRFFVPKEYPTQGDKEQHIQVNFELKPVGFKQLLEENPYFAMDDLAIVRKIGFAEIYDPYDVRNDLFVRIVEGEFTKGKTSDRNIEVIVSLCDGKGVPLEGGFIMGGGINSQDEYRSVVYNHVSKPCWNETFKVVLSVEEYENLHLKFVFKHRPSKSKLAEKHENPFALSFVRLSQDNGAVLKDETHHLLVYKIDQKKYNFRNGNYLQLASTKDDPKEGINSTVYGLTYEKDSFVIQTSLCSTKHTQNANLFDFLYRTDDLGSISLTLSEIMDVNQDEIIRFLDNVLDTLFENFTIGFNLNTSDNLMFKCLIHVIEIILDEKYEYLQPSLDSYIEKHFNYTSAYNVLIALLTECFENVTQLRKDEFDKTINALKYIIKFITKSAELYSREYEDNRLEIFEDSMSELFQLIARKMRVKPITTVLLDAGCLKQLLSSIPDMITVFNPVQLSLLWLELISSLPNHTSFTKTKLEIINEIVLSPLFLLPECRTLLLNKFLYAVKPLLEISNELESCIKILSDIMDLMHKPEFKASTYDIDEIMSIILRTVIQTIIRMNSGRLLMGNVATIMISIFRQISSENYRFFMNHFASPSVRIDFLNEVLKVLEIFITKPVYRSDWLEMILIWNSVILKILRIFAKTISEHFETPFEGQLWSSFFYCIVAFILQPALQLENFSPGKRARIISKYGDMRSLAGNKIRFMWHKLGQNKIHFVRHLVEPFLKISLIPEEKLRKCTIPLFYDMMQTEFNSTHDGEVKNNFSEFEDEMFARMDALIESGRGDEQYMTLFSRIMMNLCENEKAVLKEQGVKFITNVTDLMSRLLVYRGMINNQSKAIRLSCMGNLLGFYAKIERKEMYVRCANKLVEYHLENGNFAETAFTLKLYSELLVWSDETLSTSLRTPQYMHCDTHRKLKEALYQDMIVFLDKGEVCEYAIDVSKELIIQYEEITCDYGRLSMLLKRMSQLYDKIITRDTPTPTYFRISCYGKGFPRLIMRNNTYICRGKEYEKLADFYYRVMNEYPNAIIMQDLSPPSIEILESHEQYLQINCVKPIMDEEMRGKLLSRPTNDKIRSFYKVNGISKFQLDRPFRRREKGDGEKNEFADLWQERTIFKISSPLPGFLPWLPVVSSETYEISPLEGAIENMQKTNDDLKEMVIAYSTNITLPFREFEMRLSGILSATVNGGISRYEEAFLAPEYLQKHPENVDRINILKDLIACQIPLLRVGTEILNQRILMIIMESSLPDRDIRLLRDLLTTRKQQFQEMKADIEQKYGKRETDIEFDLSKFKKVNPSPIYSLTSLYEKRWSQISSRSSCE